jgi:uncharacterized protein (TIGR02594 family)
MSELFTTLPWLAMLIVFVGMAGLQWRVINALDQALARQPVTPIAPVPVIVPPPAVIPPPVAPPKPTGPFAGAPDWFLAALHEIGFHETGANQGIGRYIAMAHCGADGDPWCAIFANAMLESAGVTGTRSASSQSFRNHPGFVQLSGPALGALAVYWRGAQDSGLGHVGFYRGEDASSVWTLGGNENDMVQIEALPKSSSSFGLIGYWWPKAVPLPVTGAVLMPSGSPVQVQSPPSDIGAAPATPTGRQVGITATMFAGQKSAYGPPIDDTKLGVALPFHFTGERPKVRVINKAGQFVDCDIVDVGPWNIDDPYWQTGARPEAETGTDATGRKTNKAGIDLTLAAAKALQIDGKGIVDWQFIESPSIPNVS